MEGVCKCRQVLKCPNATFNEMFLLGSMSTVSFHGLTCVCTTQPKRKLLHTLFSFFPALLYLKQIFKFVNHEHCSFFTAKAFINWCMS